MTESSRTDAWSIDEGSTYFLNVDLDVWSRWPLDGFADALPRRVSRLYVGRERRIYGAHFEVGCPRDADSGIRGFLHILERLPRPAMTHWRKAHRREFNIGVQAGVRPNALEFRVQPGTLAAIAALNASVVVTVYECREPSAAPVGAQGVKEPQNDRMQLTGSAPARNRGPRS